MEKDSASHAASTLDIANENPSPPYIVGNGANGAGDDQGSLVRIRRAYDDFRTVAMSRDYYACKLSKFKRLNLAYEVVLAVGASSTVAGWYVWETASGKIVWGVYAGLVAILAIIKPIVQIPKEIERYSKLHTGYADLFYDLRVVTDNIQEHGCIRQDTSAAIAKAVSRYRELALQDDPKPSARLLDKCQKSIQRQYPAFNEWLRQSKNGDKRNEPRR